MSHLRLFRSVTAAWLLLIASLTPLVAAELTVFAAASLRSALEDVAKAYARTSTDSLRFSYAGSSVLARQIEAGAPADLYLSANSAWMDHLQHRDLLRPGSRRDLLGNRLVLIGPEGAAPQSLDASLIEALGPNRLALALVDAVPAGIYAKEALEALDLWPALAPRVAQTDNVRAALALVALGEAPYGIVYATDALAEPRVTILAEVPSHAHSPITYPVAVLAEGQQVAASRFLDYLTGAEAQAIFARHGFVPPPEPEVEE